MKIIYNKGDKVNIRSLNWFEDSKSTLGSVGTFSDSMKIFCGSSAIITDIRRLMDGINIYKLDIDNGYYIWGDYMFSNDINIGEIYRHKLVDYCKYFCRDRDNCNENCIINNNITQSYKKRENFLREGDLVTIRSSLWYNTFNVNNDIGIFTSHMEEYLGKQAEITETLFSRFTNGETRYRLDIDNGKYFWKDYMFEDDYLENVMRKDMNNFCNSQCLLECIGVKCQVYSIKK